MTPREVLLAAADYLEEHGTMRGRAFPLLPRRVQKRRISRNQKTNCNPFCCVCGARGPFRSPDCNRWAEEMKP